MKKITRRQFLTSAGATSAALLLSSLPHAAAADEKCLRKVTPAATNSNDLSWDMAEEILTHISDPVFPAYTVNVLDYGAVPNDGKLDTAAIQRAIDETSAHGGGTVVIPSGVYDVGAITLKSNVNLHLESKDTILRFTRDITPANYPLVFAHYEGSKLYNWSPLIYAYQQENIALTGKGTLDGQADKNNWWNWSRTVNPDGTITKPGSVGIPMVNTLVSVFEPGTTKELPIGERGELCICSPSMMKGYYGKPEETANILRTHEDGTVWAHTGDVGYMDEDGFVYLDSRIKRLIIRHDGFKVFPSMIENVISQHPAVHQCSVVGCTDKDHVQGRLPFVFVVLKPEAAASTKKRQIIKELRQMCAEELPEYVQPVGYKFLDAMPMTPVGKFDYRKLETEITSRDY